MGLVSSIFHEVRAKANCKPMADRLIFFAMAKHLIKSTDIPCPFLIYCWSVFFFFNEIRHGYLVSVLLGYGYVPQVFFYHFMKKTTVKAAGREALLFGNFMGYLQRV